MKKKKKTPTYNLTWEQIENIKLKATSEAMDFAFRQMMLLPLMTLRDKSYEYFKEFIKENL